MSAHEPETVADARAEVERTRDELGATVEALAYKADVKSRVKDKAEEVKAKAAETVEHVKTKAEATVDEVKAKAEDTAEHVKARAAHKVQDVKAEADDITVQAKGTVAAAGDRVRQMPPAALAGIAVAALGLVVLVVVSRRRS